MKPTYPDRKSLAILPTPIEPMPRLSQFLAGPKLWIKRDDLTGLAGGGNKTRKLEFLLADAFARGCDHLITMGAPQSNHCRQTAAAAARYGLGCSLVLRGDPQPTTTGNLLLNTLLGAHINWAGERKLAKVAVEVAARQTSLGHKPYIIPLGGSNVIGATAYVLAMEMLMAQLTAKKLNIDFIVFATSSGGTQAGLVLGSLVTGFRGKILGISVDVDSAELKTQVSALATATSTHLGLGLQPVAERVEVNSDYADPGYAVLTQLEKEAIELTATKEGILLDPVYTGRAMGGLIDLIRWGAFQRGQKVLFWHTGGTPALHAFGDGLGRG